MDTEVTGLYPATFRPLGKSYLGDQATNGTLSFTKGMPDYLAKPNHDARLIEIDGLNACLTKLQGSESQMSLAARSGVSQSVISSVNRNKGEIKFASANALYTALGGQALHIAIFEPDAPYNRTSCTLLATDVKNFRYSVGEYFYELYEAQDMDQKDVAAAVGTSQSEVSQFVNGANNPRLSNIKRYFLKTLRRPVVLCGIN